MPDIDMSKLLAAFPGAANTPENMNRLREFYATDPKALENRMYGSRMASDESGGSRDAILNSMLDKVIAQTDSQPQQSVQSEPLPMVKNASAPTKRNATAAQQPQRSDVPGDPQPLPPDNVVNPLDNATPRGGSASSDSGSWWDKLLPAILGVASTRGNDMVRSPSAASRNSYTTSQIEGPNPNTPRLTYQPKLEDTSGPKYESGATEIPKGVPQKVGAAMQDPAEVARMQSEVEAENRAAQALQDQLMERAIAQRNTAALLKNARRAVGRF